MMGELTRGMRIYRDELDSDVLCDFGFIFGDTNYRLKGTYDEVMSKLENVVENYKEYD